jgi:hypothetical protein
MKLRPLTPFALVPLAALGTLTLFASAPAGASSSTGTKVTALETEYHIALSKKSFTPGTYTFVAKNKGSITHALEITGPGLKGAKTKGINPGKSADLTVKLKVGKYDVFCPVPDHKALGMNVNLVIRASSGTSTTTTSNLPTNTSPTMAPESGG